MTENGVRSSWSQSPFQILMHDDDGLISSGTAFFYMFNGNSYLLTNRHNVTGIHPYSGAFLNPDHRRPLKLICKLSKWIDRHVKKTFSIYPFEVALFSEDRQQTLWLEHSILGRQCDLVAIPLVKPNFVPDFMHNFANKISTVRIPVKPGCPVFALVFPSNISVGFGLPIWKSGYIASEPHYPVTLGGILSEQGGMTGGITIPAFFIDSQTRNGMSGSPVFAAYTGNWDMSNPYANLEPDNPDFWSRDDIALGENRLEFVGIYSGRIPTPEGEAGLGLCWAIRAIDEVCAAITFAKHPHL